MLRCWLLGSWSAGVVDLWSVVELECMGVGLLCDLVMVNRYRMLEKHHLDAHAKNRSDPDYLFAYKDVG